MIESLARELLASWSDLAPHRAPPRRVHVLKWSVADYPHPASALLFFLFADRDVRPVAVAKVARVASGDAAVVREAEQLHRARLALPDDLRGTLPRPLRAGFQQVFIDFLDTVQCLAIFKCGEGDGLRPRQRAQNAARIVVPHVLVNHEGLVLQVGQMADEFKRRADVDFVFPDTRPDLDHRHAKPPSMSRH